MTGNQHEAGLGDDFFEQVLAVPPGYGGGGGATLPMGLQLGSSGGGGFRGMGMMPLGLNLEHGFLRHEDGVVLDNNNITNNNNNASRSAASAVSGISERDFMYMVSLFPLFGQMQTQQIRPSSLHSSSTSHFIASQHQVRLVLHRTHRALVQGYELGEDRQRIPTVSLSGYVEKESLKE